MAFAGVVHIGLTVRQERSGGTVDFSIMVGNAPWVFEDGAQIGPMIRHDKGVVVEYELEDILLPVDLIF